MTMMSTTRGTNAACLRELVCMHSVCRFAPRPAPRAWSAGAMLAVMPLGQSPICSAFNVDNAAKNIFFALYALQHRGQESAGIATSHHHTFNVHRGMGLVAQVFNEDVMSTLTGRTGIGHTRYSTKGSSVIGNAQPFVLETDKGRIAVAHNGQLVHEDMLRRRLLQQGTGLFTTTDSELIAQMLARDTADSLANIRFVYSSPDGVTEDVSLHTSAALAYEAEASAAATSASASHSSAFASTVKGARPTAADSSEDAAPLHDPAAAQADAGQGPGDIAEPPLPVHGAARADTPEAEGIVAGVPAAGVAVPAPAAFPSGGPPRGGSTGSTEEEAPPPAVGPEAGSAAASHEVSGGSGFLPRLAGDADGDEAPASAVARTRSSRSEGRGTVAFMTVGGGGGGGDDRSVTPKGEGVDFGWPTSKGVKAARVRVKSRASTGKPDAGGVTAVAPSASWQPAPQEIVLASACKDDSLVGRISSLVAQAEGAFAFVVLTRDAVYGTRDRFGFRPLCIGRRGNGDGSTSLFLSSESCALGTVGAELVREVHPGEVVRLDATGVHSWVALPEMQQHIRPALCVFEYVYFARPDSLIEGQLVHSVRQRLGRILAQECSIEADIVSGVPDSSIAAAIGFSAASGLPYTEVFCKNRYIGRTFIQPDQTLRQNAIHLKFNALTHNVAGKRLILIDDSIVRGNTLRKLVPLLREAGAKEVHICISSPPLRHPCYMGVDIGTYEELIAHNKDSIAAICAHIGADSLHYISHEGMMRAVREDIGGHHGLPASPVRVGSGVRRRLPVRSTGGADSSSHSMLQAASEKWSMPTGHCSACFTGDYPIKLEW